MTSELPTADSYSKSPYDQLLRIRKAIESSSDAISITDINGVFVYHNNAFTNLFGYYIEEINAMDGLSMLFVNPEVFKQILDSLKTGHSWISEVEMRKSSLDTFPVSLRVDSICDEEDKIVGLIGIYTDITLQKEYEHALNKRMVYENMLSLIAMRAVATDKTEDFLKESLNILGETLNINRIYIFEYSSKRHAYDKTYEWLGNEVYPQKEMPENFPAEAIPWWTEMMLNNRAIICSDIEDIPGEVEKAILRTQEIKSLLVVPFMVGSLYYGFLSFDECRYHRLWPLEDIDILKTVGQIFNWALERRRVQRKLMAHEEQLAVTVQSIGDGVVTCDINYQVILMNRAAEEITCWPAADAQGKDICEVLHIIGSSEQNDNILRDLIKSSQPLNNFPESLTLLSRDTSRKIITCTANPIRNRENRMIGMVLVLRDVTKQKKQETQAALSQKLEAIGQLAAGIAHEINTPMQFIGDNTQFLKEAFADLQSLLLEYRHLIKDLEHNDELAAGIQSLQNHEQEVDLKYLLDEIPKAIEQSLAGIARVKKLVLTMKDFAHHQRGEKHFANLNKGIESTVNISINEWKYYANLQLELDPHLPPLLCAIDEINQVVLNLIVNASHAIKDAIKKSVYEKGCITISTIRESDSILIMIKDNGLGIPANIIHRIYDPFFTTKEVGQGTGQGLAIAHDIIVSKHQGSMQVESKEGEGTCFTIILPISSPIKGGNRE